MGGAERGEGGGMIEPIKSHPGCAACQCYPECRIDCPDRERCLDRLPGYQTKLDRAKRYAAAVRARWEKHEQA
jgi:hypothetical protein